MTGYAGDDFIALNAVEGVNETIQSVFIDNVICEDDNQRCIRIYGQNNSVIDDVSIKNSILHGKYGLRILTTSGTYVEPTHELKVNCSIENCEIEGDTGQSLFFGKLNGFVHVSNTRIKSTTLWACTTFYGTQNLRVVFDDCSFSSSTDKEITTLLDEQTDETVLTKLDCYFNRCSFTQRVLYTSFNSDPHKLNFVGCKFGDRIFRSINTATKWKADISIVDCVTTVRYLVNIDAKEFVGKLYARNVKCSQEFAIIYAYSPDLTVDVLDVTSDMTGTFIPLSNNTDATFKVINLVGAYGMPINQKLGAYFERYNSSGFAGAYKYTSNGWTQFV